MERTQRRRTHQKILLPLALAGLTISACGGGSGTEATGEYDPDAEITLTIAWWGNDERVQMMMEVFDLFEDEHPNIAIQAEPTGNPEDLFNRLSTDFAAGGGPDIFALGGSMPLEYGAAGQLLDLYTVEDYVDIESYGEFSRVDATIADELYGLPTGGNSIGLLLNERLFDEVGVPLPEEDWGWDDFVEIAGEISAGTPDDVYGLDLRIQDALGVYVSQSTEYGLYDWDGGLLASEDELEPWFNQTVEMVENGGLPDPSIIVEHHNVTPDQSLFGTGHAAMSFAFTNQMPSYTAALGDDPIHVVAPPTDTGLVGADVSPSQFWSINAGTEHPQAAAMLMDFMLNNHEVAEIIKDDRGLPFNPEILETVQPLLDPASADAAEYLLQIMEDPIGKPPAPPGASVQRELSQRMESDILFGERTVEEAVQYWINHMEEQLEQ
ncbi:ABC transporter substrate-binding protein [Nesterenkonia ebinurensis]|uniref:ABC transporter substrate-binding protein n=1 Tax=Nesterenkonia ebinurensis TaxID=2608252 RepID=UPI00123D1372|nr:extracellular solute-binding protein [Nesterenkonia ebinurensis]